jgi:hypothetical protein
MIKRITIYKKLWNISPDLYMIVYTTRQIIHAFGGRQHLNNWFKRTCYEIDNL